MTTLLCPDRVSRAMACWNKNKSPLKPRLLKIQSPAQKERRPPSRSELQDWPSSGHISLTWKAAVALWQNSTVLLSGMHRPRMPGGIQLHHLQQRHLVLWRVFILLSCFVYKAALNIPRGPTLSEISVKSSWNLREIWNVKSDLRPRISVFYLRTL